ncbi:YcxB family protein [Dactylosporangium sp. NPDC005555]|uniref:YcxB family protein n=1 Tax=Dactylosporangium sp. NPDC005555 TaxID=3154889 RepID=UPI0033AAD274
MQIDMWVPYDEAQLRRTIKVVLRPQLRPIRILGAVCSALGLLLLMIGGPVGLAAAAVVVGLVCLTLVGPITVRVTVGMQPALIKDGFHLSLTDEWLAVVYPLAESRYRWAGLDHVAETPEAWYLLLGKAASLFVPKAPMTDAQRAEFTAFLAADAERRAGRASLGRPA